MKKSMLLLLVMVVLHLTAGAQSAELDNVVSKFKKFYNAQQYDSIYELLSYRLKGMVSMEKTREGLVSLRQQVGAMESFGFYRRVDAIAYYKVGFNKQKLQMMTSLSPDHKLDAMRFVPDKPVTTTPDGVELKTTTGILHGILTMPVTSEAVPVVLLIAGSGPTDKDGNNNMSGAMAVNANTYLMIADSLQKAGIACLRYDKRGVGESAGAIRREEDMIFDSMVNDAVGFINMLKADARFTDVIVAGHSEGSLIGMIAARTAGAAKYISISGAGEPADKILNTQLSAQSKTVAAAAVKIMDSLKKGYDVKIIPSGLAMLFRPSVQPYMRSWLRYNPAVEIKKLHMPVLILQGKNDFQVSVKDAEALKKAAPTAKLLLISNMNHVLKDAPADRAGNAATYSDASLPLNGQLSTAIVSFIKG